MNINMKWSRLKDYPPKETFNLSSILFPKAIMENKRTSWLTIKRLMIIPSIRVAFATKHVCVCVSYDQFPQMLIHAKPE